MVQSLAGRPRVGAGLGIWDRRLPELLERSMVECCHGGRLKGGEVRTGRPLGEGRGLRFRKKSVHSLGSLGFRKDRCA